MNKTIYTGTAGWTIASRYQDRLAGSGSHLERYAQRLNAVEINSSFRRHHRVQTYARWTTSVPPHFRFSVKVPRTLTHDGALTAQPEVLDQFIEEVLGLGPKLGVLLVQLPPRLAFDKAVARAFFSELRKRIDVHIACEPRHPSWSSDTANGVLAAYEVARVAADPPSWAGAGEPGGCEQFAYFRWHGEPRKYYSNYDAERLALRCPTTRGREYPAGVQRFVRDARADFELPSSGLEFDSAGNAHRLRRGLYSRQRCNARRCLTTLYSTGL